MQWQTWESKECKCPGRGIGVVMPAAPPPLSMKLFQEAALLSSVATKCCLLLEGPLLHRWVAFGSHVARPCEKWSCMIKTSCTSLDWPPLPSNIWRDLTSPQGCKGRRFLHILKVTSRSDCGDTVTSPQLLPGQGVANLVGKPPGSPLLKCVKTLRVKFGSKVF